MALQFLQVPCCRLANLGEVLCGLDGLSDVASAPVSVLQATVLLPRRLLTVLQHQCLL